MGSCFMRLTDALNSNTMLMNATSVSINITYVTSFELTFSNTLSITFVIVAVHFRHYVWESNQHKTNCYSIDIHSLHFSFYLQEIHILDVTFLQLTA